MQPYNPQAEPQYSGTNPGAPTVGHETRDVNVRAILLFLVSLAVAGVGVFAICFGVYSAFQHYIEVHDQKPNTWDARQQAKIDQQTLDLKKRGFNREAMEQQQYESRAESFPVPRLQTDDVRDMQMLREQEDLHLGYYYWIDQNAGKVAVPIDRAMELIAQRGLPTVAGAKPLQIPLPLTDGIVKVAHESTHESKHSNNVF